MRLNTIACVVAGAMLMAVLAHTVCGQEVGVITSRMFAGNLKQVSYLPEGADADVVRIDGQARRIDSAPLPIKGNRRYELVLNARVDSAFVVERNDRAHHLTLQSFRYALASSYQVLFLNGQGEEITSFGYGRRGFFLTEQWHRYFMAFYTPPDAVAMKVRFEPAGYATDIRDVQLAEITDDQSVNLNPDFRYGELNYSGWQPQREGRLYQRPDGVVVLRPGYGGVSPVFPLSASRAYRASARGEGGRINIVYYDGEGKRVHTRFLLRPGDGEAQVEFTPPEGAQFGQLLMYGVATLEQCEIVLATNASE